MKLKETCQWCGLHANDDEHERDVAEKTARVSEGFCVFCSGRLVMRDGRGYHCGVYQRATRNGYELQEAL